MLWKSRRAYRTTACSGSGKPCEQYVTDSQQRTILLVDDEEDVRGVLVETLKAAGYSVFDAGNYYEALKVLDGHPKGTIDLLIADVSLTGPNGCELALRFLAQQPKGRVLFISGYTGAEVCHQYDIKLSDKEFLAKPLYPKAFVERVEAVLDERDTTIPQWVSKRLERFPDETAQQHTA